MYAFQSSETMGKNFTWTLRWFFLLNKYFKKLLSSYYNNCAKVLWKIVILVKTSTMIYNIFAIVIYRYIDGIPIYKWFHDILCAWQNILLQIEIFKISCYTRNIFSNKTVDRRLCYHFCCKRVWEGEGVDMLLRPRPILHSKS